MKSIIANLKLPFLASLLLVFPFVMMQLINRRRYNESFPFALFIMLWLLPLLFMLLLLPIVHNIRAENKPLFTLPFILRAAGLIFIALMWGNIMIDQMPCFLGVQGCD